MSANFVIKQTIWKQDKQALTYIRELVFIEEQKVPEVLEWDGEDDHAIHLLASDKAGQPIGCARIIHHHIGRMAVLVPWRRQGLGQALLSHAIKRIHLNGLKQVALSAQTHAITFYAAQGFKVVSEPYLDANIWHVDMVLNI